MTRMMKVLCVTAKRADGIRRGGIWHPGETIRYRRDVFTEDQIAAMKAEPLLIVEEAEQEDPDGAVVEPDDPGAEAATKKRPGPAAKAP